jgi:hypothetical protein
MHIRKERFSEHKKSKLMLRRDDSLKESMSTKWMYKMGIMLVLYSKFLIFLCLM